MRATVFRNARPAQRCRRRDRGHNAPVFLEALQAWTNNNPRQLEAAGTTVKLSDPTAWDKPPKSVLLSTPRREGEVRVWVSGECEVIVGDVASGDPEQDTSRPDLRPGTARRTGLIPSSIPRVRLAPSGDTPEHWRSRPSSALFSDCALQVVPLASAARVCGRARERDGPRAPSRGRQTTRRGRTQSPR
jgi:hypothetical protein